MSRRLFRVFAAVAAVAYFSHTASTDAAMMNFGTFVGDTATFVDVTENNLDADLHYGSVSVLNDTLLLDPTGFGVQVSPGPGSFLIDSELEMMILAQPGFTLDSISYAEEGDYTVVGDAEVSVGLPYFWEIIEVDGVLIAPISGNGQSDFSTMTAGTGQIWRLEFGIDLAAELAAAEQTDGEIGTTINKVNLRFNNVLTATANSQTSVAFIKKKQIEGLAVNTSVPEPSSFLVLLIGLGSLLCRQRVSRSARI